jgi:hypothetical protein
VDTKKKSVGATERSETDRAAWRDLTGYLPVNDLLLVDEFGSTIGLTPLYARAPRGERAFGLAPRHWGKNTTLIAGLSLAGIQAPMMLEGAVDTLACEAYVEQVLAPSLKPDQIVVLDPSSRAYRGARAPDDCSQRLPGALLACLFAGFDTHRRGVFQTESLAASTGSAHA